MSLLRKFHRRDAEDAENEKINLELRNSGRKGHKRKKFFSFLNP
jgi:hypothetical protein